MPGNRRHADLVKLLFVVLFATSTVYADPPAARGSDAAAVTSPEDSAKDPDTALGLSLGMTAGGLGLMLLGGELREPISLVTGAAVFLVGPTIGHAYAEDTLNAGLGVRGVGAVAAVGGLRLMVDDCPVLHELPCPGTRGDIGTALLIGGGLLYFFGSLYEIDTASSAARRYNREHGFKATVVPTTNGVALVGRF